MLFLGERNLALSLASSPSSLYQEDNKWLVGHYLAQVYWELLHVLYLEGLHQNVNRHKITK